MDQATVQGYIDEFKQWAAMFGLNVDLNPLDSPLFKQWLASKYPGVIIPAGSTGTGGAAAPSTGAFGLSPNMLLGAALLGLLVLGSKKRKASR